MGLKEDQERQIAIDVALREEIATLRATVKKHETGRFEQTVAEIRRVLADGNVPMTRKVEVDGRQQDSLMDTTERVGWLVEQWKAKG